jgi:hypothetical protein
MSVRQNQLAVNRRKARRMTTPFKEFSPYEEGRNRSLRFDVNALADFEQETGMGFAQLMKQKAIFASARAMLWAGLKHEDRGISIDYVGDLLGEYITDEDVPPGEHTIDTILMVAFEAAIEQGALGLKKKDDAEAQTAAAVDETDPTAIDVKATESDPTPPHRQLP